MDGLFMKLSPAEQHNYEWLKLVIQKDSGYTLNFKAYAILNKDKFDQKIKRR